jgi:DNA-binding MarR family transcriptional regulator
MIENQLTPEQQRLLQKEQEILAQYQEGYTDLTPEEIAELEEFGNYMIQKIKNRDSASSQGN